MLIEESHVIYKEKLGLTPIQFVPVPSQNPWISNVICHGLFSMLREWKWEVIICFIEIGGIVDHHCLNFLFSTIVTCLTDLIEYAKPNSLLQKKKYNIGHRNVIYIIIFFIKEFILIWFHSLKSLTIFMINSFITCQYCHS
jgi:hypothetical protein